MIHSNYLSDLFTDTCSDNQETDTCIAFGLLDTLDVVTSLSQSNTQTH